jgi:hypothetical protein
MGLFSKYTAAGEKGRKIKFTAYFDSFLLLHCPLISGAQFENAAFYLKNFSLRAFHLALLTFKALHRKSKNE